MSVEGTWQLKVQAPAGEMPSTLEFSGERELTGKIVNPIATVDLIGTLDGDTVEFTCEMTAEQMGREMLLTFTGTVTGDEIAGDVQFDRYASGTWGATRS